MNCTSSMTCTPLCKYEHSLRKNPRSQNFKNYSQRLTFEVFLLVVIGAGSLTRYWIPYLSIPGLMGSPKGSLLSNHAQTNQENDTSIDTKKKTVKKYGSYGWRHYCSHSFFALPAHAVKHYFNAFQSVLLVSTDFSACIFMSFGAFQTRENMQQHAVIFSFFNVLELKSGMN